MCNKPTIQQQAIDLKLLLRLKDPSCDNFLAVAIEDLILLCNHFERGQFMEFFNIIEFHAKNNRILERIRLPEKPNTN